MTDAVMFPPDAHGYLRQWLLAGPVESPYRGPTTGGDDAMRAGAIDPGIAAPPVAPVLGADGPAGTRWELHNPGDNVFIEHSAFWFELTHVDSWFAAELHAEAAQTLEVWLWAAGCADLYCNGQHVARNNCWRYMYPQRKEVRLPLVAGVNRLAVRLQVLGLRDSRYLFGLQCLKSSARVKISRPGEGREPALTAPAPHASAPAAGYARGSGQHPDERRERHMRAVLNSGDAIHAAINLLCARSIGLYREGDAQIVDEACRWVDGRPDCADFALSALLRLAALDLCTQAERKRIRETAVGFRYWPDEAGADAMCYTSENHGLLFHACQMLAGRLWPEARFSASGRTGGEQAVLGRTRCDRWLERVEARGFREYMSSGYMPVTVAGLMNMVDGAGEPALSRRAAAVVDDIYRMIADHAFDGVVIAPQARVYRQVLEPETGGTQAMLSYALHEPVIAHSLWLGFLASSPDYRPPTDLAERLNRPVQRRYRQQGVDITLHKTADYILTSVDVSSALAPADDPSEDHERGLRAGLAGYQQHLWQASLGAGCHVFVNHPGEWIDHGKARPGYWYGNGVLPRTAQRGPLLMQLHRIAEDHPVPFVHAHWPADRFAETRAAAGWQVGRCGRGYVGLWCDVPLVPHDQVLVGRELRAWARNSAWVCLCGSAGEHRDLGAFLAACRALAPQHDAERATITLADGQVLDWGDGQQKDSKKGQ